MQWTGLQVETSAPRTVSAPRVRLSAVMRGHQWRPLQLVALACALSFSTSCGGPLATEQRARSTYARAPEGTRLHVLMINGGGKPAQNYQSHQLHLQQLLDLLSQRGVQRELVSVFSSDGADPGADLATRLQQPESDFWLLRGTPLARVLRTPITYANSAIPGIELQAATRAELGRWFDDAGRRLQVGDTLLLYVTDHGQKNSTDLTNNDITLWGADEALSVRELQALLEQLDPGVRVVTLMSQCFSGSFAHLMALRAVDGLPTGAACGYFSSTADRPAYGCYPENRGRDNVGHSFRFIQALTATAGLADAHAHVLVTDATPDVPLRTSDVYLEQLVEKAARERGEELNVFVDDLLRAAWRDRAAWESEIRLLDAIGAAFGFFGPRSLAELEEQTQKLPEIGRQLRTVSRAWKATAGDVNLVNLNRFLTAQPAWNERLSVPALRALDEAAARALTAALLSDLAPFTRSQRTSEPGPALLHDKGEAAAAAAYRMQVRLGVVLRMRTILTTIAGRVYLATQATAAEHAAYEALVACEDLRLPLPPAGDATLVSADPFPPFDDDVRHATEALPAWMGIRFRDTTPTLRAKLGVDAGAATVMFVYRDSPADAAKLQVGDVITGPPGTPFTEPKQIRTWTMLSKVGVPRTLELLRDGRRLRVDLVPAAYPVQWPALPGPPKVGSVAPPLKVTAYRGGLPALAAGKPYLLFFWATWCAPCKAALPDVLAFERERHTRVVAITDEAPEQLDGFFESVGEFPQNVVVDAYRQAFLTYGVSGTPTFVLVDGAGQVRSYTTGYDAGTGLQIDGWQRVTANQ